MHSQFEPSESQSTDWRSQPSLAAERATDSAKPNVTAQNESDPAAPRTEATALLERYLDQVCAKPGRVMTDAERDAMRQELRAHLLSASAAYEELGTEPTAAMREAIARFGNAAFVGKGLKQAYRPSRLSRLAGGLNGLAGVYIGGNVLAFADRLMAASGVYGNPGYSSGSEAFQVGLPLGLIVALIVWRKRLTLGQSALVGGSLYAFLTTTFVLTLIVRGQGRIHFDSAVISAIVKMCLVVGVAGTGVGLLCGATARLLRRLSEKQKATETPPALS